MRTYLFLAVLVFLPFVSHAQGTEFVPLTKLPGLDTLSTSDSLAPFLSEVYKLCIGAAAVLAVLQLMRAGVLYMGGDSFTEKKQAKELIGVALAGLLLVLSPVILFNIINPDILNLDLTSVKDLAPRNTAAGVSNTLTTNPDGSTSRQLYACPSSTQKACDDAGGQASVVCYNATTNVVLTSDARSCQAGFQPGTGCTVQADSCTLANMPVSGPTSTACPTYHGGETIVGGAACEKACTDQGFNLQITPGKSEQCVPKTAPTTATSAACAPVTDGQKVISEDDKRCCTEKGGTPTSNGKFLVCSLKK